MKTPLLLAFALASSCPAWSATFTSNPNLAVPDADFNGIADTLQITGLGTQPIRDVNVSLHLAGGWNGDYYAYLWHAGHRAILLNRVGRAAANPDGYSDGGFGPGVGDESLRLDDQAAADVHFYQASAYDLQAGRLTGAWQPDGRSLDPESSGADFEAAGRLALLDVFNGLDANGEWSLYVADVSPGAAGRLVSWSIEIQPVPEPGAVALSLATVGCD